MKKKEVAIIILGAAVLFLLFARSYFNEEVLLGPRNVYRDPVFACLDAGAGPPVLGVTCAQQAINEFKACTSCCEAKQKDCKRETKYIDVKEYEACNNDYVLCVELCGAQKRKVEGICEEDAN